MERDSILYCFAGNSIFGHRDVEMFRSSYNVKVCHYTISESRILRFFSFLKYNLSVFVRIWGVRAVVVNFGAWHAIFPVFLAMLTGKKSMIILGGFDASSIPSLKYGIFHSDTHLQWWMRKTYRWATYLCPVSEALVYSVNTYADPEGKGYKNGLLHFMPEVKNKIHVIPRQIDTHFWTYNKKVVKQGILSIAYIYSQETFYVKGFDLIMECASLMPDHHFVLAGFSSEMIKKYQEISPSNVTLMGFLTKEEARDLYQKHKIYLMPSMTEGLGQALCEAMLCGCLPVGSRVGVIPDLIQNQDFILNIKDKYGLKNCIEIALQSDISPQTWRQNVTDYFEGGLRLKKFMELIEMD